MGNEGLSDTKKDIEFAGRVLAGDGGACRRFVDDHTDWVLYKIYELMKAHCRYTARDCACCLLVLQKQRKGGSYQADRTQCDECMDSYLWFFEYLKTKVRSYKGVNNCSLKTYVWSIINSHSMYVDWLRWKYGRVF